MINGPSTNEHWRTPQKSFIHLSPLLIQKNTTRLFWSIGFLSCFQSSQCLSFYFACSAYLDWSRDDFFPPKQVFEQSQTAIMRRSSPAGDPGPAHLLSLSRRINSPIAVSCMHSSRMWFYSEIIDKNTSSYITILICPCSGGNCAPSLGSHVSQRAGEAQSCSKFRLKRDLGRGVSVQTESSPWHAKNEKPLRWN